MAQDKLNTVSHFGKKDSIHFIAESDQNTKWEILYLVVVGGQSQVSTCFQCLC